MIKKVIGWILIATPFVGLFLSIAIKDSILQALVTFAISTVLIALVIFGVKLTNSEGG